MTIATNMKKLYNIGKNGSEKMRTPLADALRPKDISEVAGQRHILSEGKILRRIIESGDIPNLIFYGPSGVGKTTVANIIAAVCNRFNNKYCKGNNSR